MILKLSDFGLLRNIKSLTDENKNNRLKIPGWTPGFYSLDYYKNKDHIIHKDEANKQDFFALGVTLFIMKYGKVLYKDYKNNNPDNFLTIADYIVDEIQNAMNEIKTTKSSEKEFIDFLISLIQFNAKDRSNFEEIYRNKWINKNWEEILEIFHINTNDEEKLIFELDKSDYLIKKKQHLDEIHSRQNNNNINNNENGNNKRIHTYNHRNKFIFKC